MNKQKLSRLAKSVRMAIKKHSPEILTGIGIAGMVTAAVMAVKATPKALYLLEKAKSDESENEKHPFVEKVKITWKCYIPATVTGGVSILCLIFASSVNARRNTALATAYSLSESALKEYQQKVVETIGEQKEQAVRDAIAKDKIDCNPVSQREILLTEKGNTLCYDALSGRYFKSDIEKLKKAANLLNRQMFDEIYISLNEFYYEVGLPGIGIGDDIGWNINRDGLVDLQFSSQLADDGTPCLVVNYLVAPRYDYMN